MSKQNDKPDSDPVEDNLLNALESIKGLLEQSETKLTAARDSINRANEPGNFKTSRSSSNNEPVVPVLDDIVEPDAYPPAAEQLEIPEVTDEAEPINAAPSPDNEQEPDTMSSPNQSDSDTMLEFLDHLQASLEKEVRNTLMRTVVNIEKEVKKTIAEQLDTIRKQIRDGK
ncbi:MAG: hypothetical protein RI563_05540 [Thiohalophilus sp.]|uniref:hypothetical protein n=1 Tax=Thiohalophilus sp. TaxID=3028392 RepID=UPI0028705579|nr:hypothetical protein [Thiohalophilus sp.]MDR9436319.1 hypothetical protein [Thiohalophilus sp.]